MFLRLVEFFLNFSQFVRAMFEVEYEMLLVSFWIDIASYVKSCVCFCARMHFLFVCFYFRMWEQGFKNFIYLIKITRMICFSDCYGEFTCLG